MNNKDLDVLMCCAFRYAVGRKTYIAPWIAEILTANVDKISESSRASIRRDIARELRDDRIDLQGCRDGWAALLEVL